MLQPDAALSAPGLPPSNGIAHVLNLPAVEEGLAHDLMVRQLVHGQQPVGVKLTEGVYVGYHASGCAKERVLKLEKGKYLPSCQICCRCEGVPRRCSRCEAWRASCRRRTSKRCAQAP